MITEFNESTLDRFELQRNSLINHIRDLERELKQAGQRKLLLEEHIRRLRKEKIEKN